jgi:hypothetical protein
MGGVSYWRFQLSENGAGGEIEAGGILGKYGSGVSLVAP